MLGLGITSWMRFFLFGFLAGVALSLVPYMPIALLGKIDAIAAFLGLILTTIYAHSYEPEVWRRLTRAFRTSHTTSSLRQSPANSVMHTPGEQTSALSP